MPKKTDIELQKDEIADTVRTLIRMKHRQQANREINDRLYAAIDEFQKGLHDGELRQIPTGDVIDKLLGGPDGGNKKA